MDRIINSIKEEDLPEGFKLVAETCGIDVCRTLIENLPGISVNVPMLTSLKPLIERYIVENQERPRKIIALELGVSEKRVREVLRRK